MLEIINVAVGFQKDKPIIQNICFNLLGGQTISIIGNNGSGKSTLCLAINKIIPELIFAYCNGKFLYKGETYIRKEIINEILFFLQDVDSQLVALRLTKDFYPNLIKSGFYSKSQVASIKSKLSSSISVGSLKFSEGEKQRMVLSYILAKNPNFLILDEPTSNLDLIEKENLIKLLNKKKKNGIGLLIVSHDLTFIEQVSDQFYYINVSTGSFINKKQLLNYFNLDLPTIKNSNNITNQNNFNGKNISFKYKSEKRKILNNLDFSFKSGYVNGIIGRNGCGKSTLMKYIINNLNSKNISYNNEQKPKISLLLQNPNHQIFCSTIKEELKFGLKQNKLSNRYGVSSP